MRSHFSNRLREKVKEAIATRAEGLASGAAGGDDAASVGMAYAKQVGHIAGLNEALAIADEIEKEQEN